MGRPRHLGEGTRRMTPKDEFVKKTASDIRDRYRKLAEYSNSKLIGVSQQEIVRLRIALVELRDSSELKGLYFTIVLNTLSDIIGFEHVLDQMEKGESPYE